MKARLAIVLIDGTLFFAAASAGLYLCLKAIFHGDLEMAALWGTVSSYWGYRFHRRPVEEGERDAA